MENIEDKILCSLRRIIRGVDIYSRQLNIKLGLTSPQLLCLREVVAAENITLSELKKKVDLSASTVTGIIDRLEAKGFVERQRSSLDRRKVFVCATLRGIEILGTSPSLLQDNFAESLQNLNDKEQRIISESLERVVTLMKLEDVDASPNLIPSPSNEIYMEGENYFKPK